MSRTYVSPAYGFPLVKLLFSLSARVTVGLVMDIEYFVGIQCTDGYIAHCPQGALHEAVAAGRTAFTHMAVALWLHGLAMLVLAGAMGRVKLALICHAVAAIAVFVGWQAEVPAGRLVLCMLWSMMFTAAGKGVFEGVSYVWQKVGGNKHVEQEQKMI